MKIPAAAVLFAFSLTSTSADKPLHQPHRISYEDLVSKSYNEEAFADALTSVGLVAVNSIPGYASQRHEALRPLHGCSLESKATMSHEFEDGTVRRTMATHTVPGPGGAQAISHDSDHCVSFDVASKTLRSMVADVTAEFGNALGEMTNTQKPLLETQDGEYAFSGVANVVENGEHLEHFHSYQRPSDAIKEETIKLHTDQGLFIAFTPGLMVDPEENVVETQSSSGFHIELEDGTDALVDFRDDDLIFMLGDGVNQIINPKIYDGGRKLRATPHALSMPNHKENEARVWYGRMVLAPADAVHPEHGDTFGNIRNLMIKAAATGEHTEKLGLGCSSTQIARNLDEVVCEEENHIYCWARCMDITEEGIPSMDFCEVERNLRLDCVNPRNQTYIGGHGDYYPACTASTENATAYPKLPVHQEIRDPKVCTDEAYADFSNTTGYDHSFDLGNAIFMWSVVDGKVDGRLAFDGVFGFLSIGHAHYGGPPHDGMNGASIIMALPGGNYDAVTGLNMSLPHEVNEYKIADDISAFRHWQDPITGADTSSYDVEVVKHCFTAIKFNTSEINGIPFNLSGENDLIWAANNQDYYAGYHGRENRGIFVVDFSDGHAHMKGHDHDHDHDTESKEASAASSMNSLWSTASLLAVMCMALNM